VGVNASSCLFRTIRQIEADYQQRYVHVAYIVFSFLKRDYFQRWARTPAYESVINWTVPKLWMLYFRTSQMKHGSKSDLSLISTSHKIATAHDLCQVAHLKALHYIPTSQITSSTPLVRDLPGRYLSPLLSTLGIAFDENLLKAWSHTGIPQSHQPKWDRKTHLTSTFFS